MGCPWNRTPEENKLARPLLRVEGPAVVRRRHTARCHHNFLGEKEMNALRLGLAVAAFGLSTSVCPSVRADQEPVLASFKIVPRDTRPIVEVYLRATFSIGGNPHVTNQ